MSLNIYFCGSIRGGRDDALLYAAIIGELKAYGRVLTEHVGSANVLDEEWKDSAAVYRRDLDWLKIADVIVAEVTQPSLGVGFEIGVAVSMQKKVLCLFRPNTGKELSCMIKGADDGSSFIVRNYKDSEYLDILKDYFSSV